MAQVTLRDLATNEDIVVPPEGFIFGRVGGDADIQIEDNSISRRQARVSLKGGQWLLETLAVPQGQKAPRPIALQEGATFNVGQSEFEVVQVEEDEEEEPAKTVAPPPVKGKPGAPPQASAAKKPNAAPNAKTTPSQSSQKRPAAKEEADGGDAIPKKGIGALFVGVPKGIAYYLVNVPKLLVNPMGTVRKTLEEQPAEPMGPIEMIGYALPAGLASMLLGSWAGGIALLIGPTHSFSIMAFFPIVSLIIGVVIAVVTGFVFHPVMKWIITKLKGESDERSRSNYFLQFQTINLVLAVPSALAVILGSLPVPFLGLIGLLLGLVASLAAIYVHFQWFTFFKVVKWFKTLLLVCGALVVVLAAKNLVFGIIDGVKGLGSGGGAAVVATNDGDSADVADGDTGAIEEMPTDPEELKAWSEKKQKQLAAKAAADLKKAQAAAAKDAPKDDGDEAAPPEPKEPKKDTKTAAKDEPKPAKDEPKPAKDEPKDEPVAAKDTPPAPVKVDAAPITASGAYGTFARRRDTIEKTFEADPTILAKSTELQKLYSEYLDAAYDLDKKLNKDNQKKPELSKLNARLHDAELFTKTSKTIDQLAEKMKIK